MHLQLLALYIQPAAPAALQQALQALEVAAFWVQAAWGSLSPEQVQPVDSSVSQSVAVRMKTIQMGCRARMMVRW